MGADPGDLVLLALSAEPTTSIERDGELPRFTVNPLATSAGNLLKRQAKRGTNAMATDTLIDGHPSNPKWHAVVFLFQ